MIVRVQLVEKGCQGYFFQGLTCGGILIRTLSGKWTRKSARAMLNALGYELPFVKRANIRFKHV